MNERIIADIADKAVSYADGNMTLRELQYLITKDVAQACEKISKAFGGCTLCYGKGYSTSINGYSDEGTGEKWQEEEILYCKCARGEQLREHITRMAARLKKQLIQQHEIAKR